MNQEATSVAENIQKRPSKERIITPYSPDAGLNGLEEANGIEKKCKMKSKLTKPVQRLSIAEVLNSHKVVEALSISDKSHNPAQKGELSYTINSDPDDGAIETFGDIEDGEQYLLDAVYRVWHRGQIIAEIKWSQEEESDTDIWTLNIEISSQDHLVTDSIFQTIREQITREKDDSEEKLSYHG